MTAIRLSDDLSDAEKRAIRRSLNATEAPKTIELVEPARGETLKDLLIAFRDGRDSLHGTPRGLVDIDAFIAKLERAER